MSPYITDTSGECQERYGMRNEHSSHRARSADRRRTGAQCVNCFTMFVYAYQLARNESMKRFESCQLPNLPTRQSYRPDVPRFTIDVIRGARLTPRHALLFAASGWHGARGRSGRQYSRSPSMRTDGNVVPGGVKFGARNDRHAAATCYDVGSSHTSGPARVSRNRR